MADYSTVARPYAQAAFDYAKESGQVDGWSAFLLGLAEFVADDKAQAFLQAPHFRAEDHAGLLDALEGKVDAAQLTFAKMLATGKRLAAAGEIATQFKALVDAHEATCEAIVYSVSPLDDAVQQRLKQRLEKKFAKTVTLTVKVEPTVVGGLLIQVGDKVIDASVRGQLKQLKAQLK